MYSLFKDSNEKFDYDLISMNKLAIEMFIQLYGEKMPLETVTFLIDQYELVSEFESAPVENEVFKSNNSCV